MRKWRLVGRALFSRVRQFFNRRLVRLSLVIAIIGALAWKVDRGHLRESLMRFDPLIGVAMGGVFLLLVGLFALRWWYIGTALGVRAPLKDFVRAIWISQCVSELGPALVVGEVARFQSMRGYGDDWPLAVSQAIDRLSGKVVLLLMVAALTPYYAERYSDFPLGQIGYVVLVLVAGVSLAVLIVRRFWPMARLHRAAVLTVSNPWVSPQHYGVSLLIQSLLAANLSLAALGLGVSREAAGTVFLLGPLLLLGVGTLPGLVSDWGKREAAAIVLLAPAGLVAEESLALSLVFGLIHLVMALPGALFLLARRGAKGQRTSL